MNLKLAYKISNILAIVSVAAGIFLYVSSQDSRTFYFATGVLLLLIVVCVYLKFKYCRCPGCNELIKGWNLTPPDECPRCHCKLK